jgi:hypothetical protein
MNKLGNVHFTFNTTGSVNESDNFKVYLDKNGNPITNELEYGVYNKIIEINFNKLLMIKLQYIGFGDIIDFITKITGIKKLIIKLTNGNCGCEQRRIKFNSYLKFYYPILKFRNLYIEDESFLKKNKVINQKNFKPKKIMSSNKVEVIEQTIKPNITEKKPLTTAQIKKSCNCKKNKKPL